MLTKFLDADVQLKVKIHNDSGNRLCDEATLTVPTLEISVDMLRRLMYRDEAVLKMLNLPKMTSVVLGKIEKGDDKKEHFVSYPPTDSLLSCGISRDCAVYIKIMKD